MFIQLKNLQIGYDKPLITNINTYLKQGDVCLIIGNNDKNTSPTNTNPQRRDFHQ